ncbi:MAG: geranylgeranylglycerol-phosphate geranylgeranyltransferase [Bacteroidota bacterium]|nr:geranylgeranylglycerol-phosphate geranylgeranyltransferase [Bacteroidota bacterium]
MKVIAAFFKLIRWPNLVFIILTQVLFEYCIYFRVFPPSMRYQNEQYQFFLLVAASICIAAAGYIINDYFDLNIDQINKPDKVVVNSIISRRWVILWHLLLSLAGLILTIVALPHKLYLPLIMANTISIFLLLLYSSTLKKRLLIGNVLISLLTAWVIAVIFFSKMNESFLQGKGDEILHVRFFRLTVLYAGFAFIISLIREVIKDMEDIEGDRKYECRTMPIVWGLNASKVFVAVWLSVLITILFILQLYVWQFDWWFSILYCTGLIIIPLIWVLKKLFTASSSKDFHELSTAVKMIMFTGILSMLFFLFYH